tara:strand:- start:291 stop:563 length:273 start_codon:yes stop_codon:yes gene_type:complete
MKTTTNSQQTNPITLEQTIQKVKEHNKEIKLMKELLGDILTHISHTYGNINSIANVLNAAEKEWIPEDKEGQINHYKNKIKEVTNEDIPA